MAQQLPFFDGKPAKREPEWRIDEKTKAIGRKGLAQARAALAATASPDDARTHEQGRGLPHQHRDAA